MNLIFKALDTVARTADALCEKMQTLSVSGAQAGDVAQRLGSVEAENKSLRSLLTCLEARLTKLEGGAAPAPVAKAAAPAPVAKAAAPAAAPAAKKDEDDFDLFGDEEPDEEVEKRNAERVAAYNAKKAAKGSESHGEIIGK